jgi:hypothetical protein
VSLSRGKRLEARTRNKVEAAKPSDSEIFIAIPNMVQQLPVYLPRLVLRAVAAAPKNELRRLEQMRSGDVVHASGL